MPNARWNKAVILICKTSGQEVSLTTAAEALEFLLNKWPTTSGRNFFAALQICAGVEEDLFTPDRARESLIEAAREASIDFIG